MLIGLKVIFRCTTIKIYFKKKSHIAIPINNLTCSGISILYYLSIEQIATPQITYIDDFFLNLLQCVSYHIMKITYTLLFLVWSAKCNKKNLDIPIPVTTAGRFRKNLAMRSEKSMMWFRLNEEAEAESKKVVAVWYFVEQTNSNNKKTRSTRLIVELWYSPNRTRYQHTSKQNKKISMRLCCWCTVMAANIIFYNISPLHIK